mmetsp:Transcript_55210/g.176936  ORF Transcript_55210/g.176936 Transcript_55210/m.176936 type:complete len:243 (-) Transcript_55210:233-961(-)
MNCSRHSGKRLSWPQMQICVLGPSRSRSATSRKRMRMSARNSLPMTGSLMVTCAHRLSFSPIGSARGPIEERVCRIRPWTARSAAMTASSCRSLDSTSSTTPESSSSSCSPPPLHLARARRRSTSSCSNALAASKTRHSRQRLRRASRPAFRPLASGPSPAAGASSSTSTSASLDSAGPLPRRCSLWTLMACRVGSDSRAVRRSLRLSERLGFWISTLSSRRPSSSFASPSRAAASVLWPLP